MLLILFLNPREESASIHADPDPGGLFKCGPGSEILVDTLVWFSKLRNAIYSKLFFALGSCKLGAKGERYRTLPVRYVI